jgi:branched-subunit amino acid ABC-type transport system permease component
MKIYLVLLASTVAGLALGALVDLQATNPAIGNTLTVLIFGSAIIAGIIQTEKSK